ncbi:hypothetical protein QOT17_024052 [Balamuthia mandrillaris]
MKSGKVKLKRHAGQNLPRKGSWWSVFCSKQSNTKSCLYAVIFACSVADLGRRPATKFTALALMSLYLRRRATSKWTSAPKQKLQLEHLQLMVSACLHVCSKQLERKSSYQNAIPKALDRKDRALLQHFKACELELLTVLRFQLRPATPYDFLELQLRLFAHYFGVDREKALHDLAILLLELLYFPSPNAFLQQPFELLAISCWGLLPLLTAGRKYLVLFCTGAAL